jgi:competence protein ComEA
LLSGVRERLDDIAARAGLVGVPTPVLAAACLLAAGAVAWAAVRWTPAAGPEVFTSGGGASEPTRSAPVSRPASSQAPADLFVVDVVGAVRRAGVYRLPKGSRADDAVKAAGGALGNADLAAVNLAAQVTDGEQLVVPVQGESAAPVTGGSAQAKPGGVAKPAGKVDINHATAEELDALPGVGPSTAAKIVSEREANGPYKSVEDLMRVPGIGAKKLDALKDLVTAG